MKYTNTLRFVMALSTLIVSVNIFANDRGEDAKQMASKSQCFEDKTQKSREDHQQRDCLFGQWYVHLGLGYVSGDMNNSDVQSAASQLGFDVFDIDVDDSRFGFKFNLGTSLTEHLSLELGYTNLGEVSAAFSTETAIPEVFFDVTRGIHPLSVKGFTLSGVYQFWHHEEWYLHARLGLFAWDGDYDSLDVFEQRTLPKLGSVNGTDIYFGLGANYQLDEDIQVTLEWERYRIESENSDLLMLGLSYHFD